MNSSLLHQKSRLIWKAETRLNQPKLARQASNITSVHNWTE